MKSSLCGIQFITYIDNRLSKFNCTIQSLMDIGASWTSTMDLVFTSIEAFWICKTSYFKFDIWRANLNWIYEITHSLDNGIVVMQFQASRIPLELQKRRKNSTGLQVQTCKCLATGTSVCDCVHERHK